MKVLNNLKNIDFRSIDLKNPQMQTLLAVILIFLIVAAAYIYFVFIPQFVKVLVVFDNIEKTRMELKTAQIVIADTDKLKKSMKEHSEKVESYEKKLPAQQEIPTLLENLSGMAKDSRIKIIGITPVMPCFSDDKSGDKSQIYQEIPILITAKSGYHQLGHFINSLENADRFMKVADINIKANRTTPEEQDVELIVCTYVLLPQK